VPGVFSYIDIAGDLHENVYIDDSPEKDYGGKYGCGIFEMTKI
jgi:hypothetical protein